MAELKTIKAGYIVVPRLEKVSDAAFDTTFHQLLEGAKDEKDRLNEMGVKSDIRRVYYVRQKR